MSYDDRKEVMPHVPDDDRRSGLHATPGGAHPNNALTDPRTPTAEEVAALVAEIRRTGLFDAVELCHALTALAARVAELEIEVRDANEAAEYEHGRFKARGRELDLIEAERGRALQAARELRRRLLQTDPIRSDDLAACARTAWVEPAEGDAK